MQFTALRIGGPDLTKSLGSSIQIPPGMDVAHMQHKAIRKPISPAKFAEPVRIFSPAEDVPVHTEINPKDPDRIDFVHPQDFSARELGVGQNRIHSLRRRTIPQLARGGEPVGIPFRTGGIGNIMQCYQGRAGRPQRSGIAWRMENFRGLLSQRAGQREVAPEKIVAREGAGRDNADAF